MILPTTVDNSVLSDSFYSILGKWEVRKKGKNGGLEDYYRGYTILAGVHEIHFFCPR